MFPTVVRHGVCRIFFHFIILPDSRTVHAAVLDNERAGQYNSRRCSNMLAGWAYHIKESSEEKIPAQTLEENLSHCQF